MNDESIAAAVHEAGTLLRADGADLRLVEANPAMARVKVAVVLEDASCVDCVVEPDLLAELLTTSISRHLAEEIEVLVDDPRR